MKIYSKNQKIYSNFLIKCQKARLIDKLSELLYINKDKKGDFLQILYEKEQNS